LLDGQQQAGLNGEFPWYEYAGTAADGEKGLNIRLIGSGRVVEQNPPPGQKINPSDPVWVKLAPSA
jgi:hypothetical protein